MTSVKLTKQLNDDLTYPVWQRNNLVEMTGKQIKENRYIQITQAEYDDILKRLEVLEGKL